MATITVRDLAAKSKYSTATIYQWIKEKRFTVYRPGRKILIDVEGYEAFLQRTRDGMMDPDVSGLLAGLRRKSA